MNVVSVGIARRGLSAVLTADDASVFATRLIVCACYAHFAVLRAIAPDSATFGAIFLQHRPHFRNVHAKVAATEIEIYGTALQPIREAQRN